jgi:16S rRNA C967 or C1407 C5-methylase (RsmB/RsmF family)
MYRHSRALLRDKHAEKQQLVLDFLNRHASAADFAVSFAALLSGTAAQQRTERVAEAIAACRKHRLWMQGAVVLTVARREEVALRESWFDDVVAAARATGDRSVIRACKERLAPLYGRRGPATARRSSEPGEHADTAVATGALSVEVREAATTPAEAAADNIITQLNDGLVGAERVSSHALSPDTKAQLSRVQLTGGAVTGEAAQLLRTAVDPRRRNALMRAMGRPTALRAIHPSFDRFFLHQPFINGDANALVMFTQSLCAPPPRVVRINTSRTLWPLVAVEAASQAGLQPVRWYPDAVAWQVSTGATPLERARALRWARDACDAGHASLQSPSSLLPALALAPTRSSAVLDLCAAPGSKTRQILDLVGGGAGGVAKDDADNAGSMNASGNGAGSGYVIANERDAQRYVALHRNVGSGYRHAATIHADARSLVDVFGSGSFDRVLVDAPCSGEGTFYKDNTSAAHWSPAAVGKLHRRQVELLLQGIAHTRPGGAVVYSTCTLNPIENEAVVAEALRRSDGACRLVAPELPPTLQSLLAPGLASWFIPPEFRHDMPQSAGTPADTHADLSLCRRVFPLKAKRLLDGFFFARLERVDRGHTPLILSSADGGGATRSSTAQTASEATLTHLQQHWTRLAVTPAPGDVALRDLLSTFGVAPSVVPPTLAFVRRPSSLSTRSQQDYDIVAVATGLVEFAWRRLSKPSRSDAALEAGGLTVCHVRVTDGDVQWTLTNDGAQLLLPLATRRVITLSAPAFLRLVGNEELSSAETADARALVRNVAQPGTAPHHEEWLAATRGLDPGPIIARYTTNELPLHVTANMAKQARASAATVRQHLARLKTSIAVAAHVEAASDAVATTALVLAPMPSAEKGALQRTLASHLALVDSPRAPDEHVATRHSYQQHASTLGLTLGAAAAGVERARVSMAAALADDVGRGGQRAHGSSATVFEV